MATNLLFWTIFLALVIGAAVHAIALRRREEQPLQEGSIELDALPGWPLERGDYSIGTVDVMASHDRKRAVITVDIKDDDSQRRREALKFLGHEIFRRLSVDVVLVEGTGPDGAPELYLFAADGRGWWGREVFSEGFGNPSAHAHQRA